MGGMKFWQALSFTETEQLPALARICEEVGFFGVNVADHVFVPEVVRSRYHYSEDGRPPFGSETEFPEPWAAISAMAAVTERLHFTTAVYLAPLRHPLVVAKSVATAAALSGGRVTLGAAVGWMREEFDELGEDFGTRGRRLDEMLEILRTAFAGAPFEHRGRFYDWGRVRIAPAPPGPVPIWIGGASDAALRRAARNDGWLGAGNAPDEMPGVMETLRRHRREAGREGEPFEVIAALTEPPTPDRVRRMEDLGVTGFVSYPLLYVLGPGTSVAEKRAALERYGDEIIAKSR